MLNVNNQNANKLDYASLVSKSTSDNPLSLAKASKDYRDKHFSGLTDEERAEIEKLIEQYLKDHPMETKDDIEAFNAYVKSLYKKYGAKEDMDSFSALLQSKTQKV